MRYNAMGQWSTSCVNLSQISHNFLSTHNLCLG